MLDISNFTQLTQEQAIVVCNNSVAQPALIFLFIAFILAFIVFGFIFIKKNRDKLALILTCTFVFAGIFLLIFIFMPITVQSAWNFFGKLFS